MARSVIVGPLLLAAMLAACVRVVVHGDPQAAQAPLRVATYNVSLYDDARGGLIRRLQAGDPGARKIAAVLQRVRPDIVLLNEFDFDPDGRAAELFQREYLERAQVGGGEPLRYPHRYLAPVNTGVASGLDLNRDGVVGTGGRPYGDDAWGYGLHPGQYGMLVLSRHPIAARDVRSFRLLKWSAMPDALRPQDPKTGRPFHPDAVWQALRLSSKSHWDVPIRTPQGVIHLLASHPTPPVFDGPEDRNGARNADEIRLWREYIGGGPLPWLCDDTGRCGGLAADARFVIAGDLNSDPQDGDSRKHAIRSLLQHPRVLRHAAPASAGAPERARGYALPRIGDAAAHTGDFGPKAGTLRLDYLLPSGNLRIEGGAVFWPASGDPRAAIADGSDHHLVWLDLRPAP